MAAGRTRHEKCARCCERDSRHECGHAVGSRRTSSGFLFKHNATNSLKATDHLPSSTGGSFLGIRKSARIGCRSDRGGSFLANSMAVMPNDQISA